MILRAKWSRSYDSIINRAAVLFSNNKPKKIMTSEGCKWMAGGIKGFLLDVYGVLYDAGSSDVPITGSIEAVRK